MKYKRIIVTRPGGPEVLQVLEADLPEPQPGEVRVKILAAGVAWGDVLKCRGLGMPPPFTPGYDLVGIVDKPGEGVASFEVGQTVAALPLYGGYAEYICLPASELVHVPSGLDPAEAVCLVMNYVTAYQMLHRAAHVKAGDRILIHSAAGGVGTALLDLGRLAELKMLGAASTGKQKIVADMGGIPIDYRKDDFVEQVFALTGDGVDVVFDPFGGTHILRSYQALRTGGRLVVFGAHNIFEEGKLKWVLGRLLGLVLNMIPDNRTILRYDITGQRYSKLEWCHDDLSGLFGLLAQKKIEPVIAARIPLLEAARAHELLWNGSVTGKLVLICNT